MMMDLCGMEALSGAVAASIACLTKVSAASIFTLEMGWQKMMVVTFRECA